MPIERSFVFAYGPPKTWITEQTIRLINESSGLQFRRTRFIVASRATKPLHRQAKVVAGDALQSMIYWHNYINFGVERTDANKHWKCAPSILAAPPRFQCVPRKVNTTRAILYDLRHGEIFVDSPMKCLLVSGDSENYHVHSLRVTVGLPFGLDMCACVCSGTSYVDSECESSILSLH